MVVDFRRPRRDNSLLTINNSPVEIIQSQFLGVHIMEYLTWSLNTIFIAKKAQQLLPAETEKSLSSSPCSTEKP